MHKRKRTWGVALHYFHYFRPRQVFRFRSVRIRRLAGWTLGALQKSNERFRNGITRDTQRWLARGHLRD